METRKIVNLLNDFYNENSKFATKNWHVIDSWFKQKKALNTDSKAIQPIILTGKIKVTEGNTRVIIYYVLEKSKETIL